MKDRYKKLYVYFIRAVGWIMLLIAIHIGLFHSEILKRYPILTLVLSLMFILTDYKINYKQMKPSKRVAILLYYVAIYIFCGYIVYNLGCFLH